MSALTIYECPVCGHIDAYLEIEPCEGCYDEHGGDPHPPVQPVAVRVFREEDVRPLWDVHAEKAKNGGFAQSTLVAKAALDAFPAPDDWTAER